MLLFELLGWYFIITSFVTLPLFITNTCNQHVINTYPQVIVYFTIDFYEIFNFLNLMLQFQKPMVNTHIKIYLFHLCPSQIKTCNKRQYYTE